MTPGEEDGKGVTLVLVFLVAQAVPQHHDLVAARIGIILRVQPGID